MKKNVIGTKNVDEATSIACPITTKLSAYTADEELFLWEDIKRY
ncbi:hypothetical protein J2Z83_001300 [Virgibacillus natechei]|uniref:Uncharacterized protein n=1 Tax=Virgibacillus natechei TaxID=1216297 RepID=A0ABS4IE19_9BACI|nr:hypothetical protein [Virgibacillus natechei]